MRASFQERRASLASKGRVVARKSRSSPPQEPPAPGQGRPEEPGHAQGQQAQDPRPEQHLDLQHLGRVAVLDHALRVPADEQGLPEADVELAAKIVGQGAVVEVLDLGLGHEDQTVALLRQAKAQLLVLHTGRGESGIEAAVLAENVPAIGRGVGVDEVDAVLAPHAVVAVLVLGLDEAGHQAGLVCQVSALGPHHVRLLEGPQQGLGPVRNWGAVRVGEEDVRSPSHLGPVVAGCGRASVLLAHQPGLAIRVAGDPGHHLLGRAVGGAVVHHDDLGLAGGQGLLRQGAQATIHEVGAVVDRHDDGTAKGLAVALGHTEDLVIRRCRGTGPPR